MSKDRRERVLRGGSWNYAPAWARVAIRAGGEPSDRILNLGFRLARMVSPLGRLAEVGLEVRDEQG